MSNWKGALGAIGLACGLACGGETAPESARSSGPQPTSPLAERLEIESVELLPPNPVPGRKIAAQVKTRGAPRHETTLEYEWFVDGRRQAETRHEFSVLSDHERGSRIEVSVVALHGERRSAAARAGTSIANSPPVLHSLVFEPMKELEAGQDVVAIPNASDVDGDELSFSYEWWVDGQRIEADDRVLPASALRRGSQVVVRVRASDDQDSSNEIQSQPIPVRNAAPRIVSTPGGFDEQGRFVYPLQVDDPDDRRGFSYRLLEGPQGMLMDALEGTLSWTPVESQAGRHPVRIEVRDPHGGVGTQSFVLELGFEEASAAPAAQAEAPQD